MKLLSVQTPKKIFAKAVVNVIRHQYSFTRLKISRTVYHIQKCSVQCVIQYNYSLHDNYDN